MDTKNKHIIDSGISFEMKRSYLNYAMSVIVSRALPDIRDGLKPVHRRILYAMYSVGLKSTAHFSKSAKVVGEVLGKYHPHGDSPVYDALVRMAQTFSMRYPLVNGQGNFGSMDGDPPAAMRYTEVKLTKIAEELLFDIDKETVAMIDNFDGTLKEPLYFPAKLPNLLLMGSEGIAVGMATKIPPHNLTEIIDAVCFTIDNAKNLKNPSSEFYLQYIPPKKTEYDPFTKTTVKEIEKPVQKIFFDTNLDDLLEYVQGPDFPTGALIYGTEEIKQMYSTGKGKVLVRALIEHEETTKGRDAIIVRELPYQTNKATLVARIAELARDKKIQGIADLRDESDRDGVRVVIELKRDAVYKKVLNNLFKHTELQTTYPANIVVLVNDTPQTASLKQILEHYLRHRIDVIKKRSIYELKQAKHRAHILEGLLIALKHIDEIIAIIKKSKNEADAKINLIAKFDFSEIQAQAILDMQLKKLTGLEREKIEDELAKLNTLITGLEKLISDVFKILEKIKQEILELKKIYGDERRTKIYKHMPDKFTDEQLIENKEVIITMTNEDYIKTVPRETFKVQNRGGKGVTGIETKEEDNVTRIKTAMTHDAVLFFTNTGKVFQTRVWEIPQGTRTSKGKAIVNLLSMSPTESITSVLTYDPTKIKKSDKIYIFMCTKKGTVKKTELQLFANIKKSGIIAIKLDTGDQLQWAEITDGSKNIIITTHMGKSISFAERDVRPMGRSSKGVIGMKFSPDDFVTSMDCYGKEDRDKFLIVISERGIGKKTKLSLFPVQHRGGKGVKVANTDTRTGKIAYSSIIGETRETMIITSQKGQVVKISLKSVPAHSRNAKGVILMRLTKDDIVTDAAFL